MSVAGILASNLFSTAGSLIAQKPPSTAKGHNSAEQPSFAAEQQKLSTPGSSSPAGATSLPAQLTQLGQDLQAGNLQSAQADFAAFRIALEHSPASHGKHSREGSGGSDPLSAAMQAYSSLQQSPAINGLSSSMMAPASAFAVDA